MIAGMGMPFGMTTGIIPYAFSAHRATNSETAVTFAADRQIGTVKV